MFKKYKKSEADYMNLQNTFSLGQVLFRFIVFLFYFLTTMKNAFNLNNICAQSVKFELKINFGEKYYHKFGSNHDFFLF